MNKQRDCRCPYSCRGYYVAFDGISTSGLSFSENAWRFARIQNDSLISSNTPLHSAHCALLWWAIFPSSCTCDESLLSLSHSVSRNSRIVLCCFCAVRGDRWRGSAYLLSEETAHGANDCSDFRRQTIHAWVAKASKQASNSHSLRGNLRFTVLSIVLISNRFVSCCSGVVHFGWSRLKHLERTNSARAGNHLIREMLLDERVNLTSNQSLL